MAPDFHFRADHPDPGTTRWLHICFYLGAVLLAIAGVYELYLYATHWSAGEDSSHLWMLILGVIYLVVAGLVAYATYNHGGSGEIPPERFVRIQDGVMTYQLDQLQKEQKIRLANVRSVHRPTVRDLVLELTDGRRVTLPVYLIDEEEKQRELEVFLTRSASSQA
ncbi:DUF308 domain-containing protein [Lewinella sp. IMCC34191]|uniref:DUF308 domain-containing protein n=1 Tax=Lewinella sp. IMCC34191 TaxID=2259172 RepID=UPI000E2503AD|nr:DUF308 domain-containing protein [Lewinella sp. IMCC34191]